MPTLGLTSSSARERLLKYGANKLPEKPPPSDFFIFLSQLKSPLVYVLLGACLVTLLLRDYKDSIVIAFAVFINTILGFVQERKANSALSSLKKLVQPKAEVLRDGKRVTINAELLVSGDVVFLTAGAKVPADGELIEANRLFISEAILTGESVPSSKNSGEKAFMGTSVEGGNGLLRVESTGAETKVGEIALKVQEVQADTPLQEQLKVFSKQLTLVVLVLVLIVFAGGFLRGREILEMFTASVALAVSAIPEGLLVALTVVLAIGMQKILKREGLVRNLVSAEVLGGVTTVCVDKTGTLTEGRIEVAEVRGDEDLAQLQAVLANDLDDPMVNALWEWTEQRLPGTEDLIKKHERLDSLPFSSKERYFASLHNWEEDKHMLFVNGAPDYLLSWCEMPKKEKEKILEEVEELTSSGMRVIGMARKTVSNKKNSIDTKDVKNGLSWIALAVFSDPIREGVKEALEAASTAGVRTIVITGDYANTALAVSRQLGIDIDSKDIVLGDELGDLSQEDLTRILKTPGPKLFARTTPEQKFNIVEALQKNGEVVAMMGDGVNDAPALHRADIGVVVDGASDTARESAALILLDSRFSTIVAAIEEGRKIFENMRKIVLYLLSDAFAEILAVLGSIAIGFPLPITAAQILWINLVSDGLPSLALTVEPGRQDVMKEPPRFSGEKLVTGWMMILILIVGVVCGLSAFLVFWLIYSKSGDVNLARSAAFATLGFNSLVYVFSLRVLRAPIWRENPFSNLWLVVAVLAGAGLQISPFVFRSLGKFLDVEQLGREEWVLVGIASVVILVFVEVLKFVLVPKGNGQKKV